VDAQEMPVTLQTHVRTAAASSIPNLPDDHHKQKIRRAFARVDCNIHESPLASYL
jgi:hypothetical protein